MAKTQKELAFLRELSVDEQWTRRFTDLIDKHFDFTDNENLLNINASTGSHAFELSEKLEDKTNIFATAENEDMLRIARDKAAAIRSGVDFSMIRFDEDSFDAVLADASLLRPREYEAVIDETIRTAKSGANIGILSVTAGSFGEIFSLLWEVLFNEGLGDHGRVAEDMIAELPTVTQLEKTAKSAGMENVQSHTANEVFEFENGAEFVNSTLVSDFLLPDWLSSLSEEEKERVMGKLAELIDAEDGNLSFRFSVKATLVTGEKA
jgi:ubiquinone/menaquinone biosynthesis C-methylase UbiE